MSSPFTFPSPFPNPLIFPSPTPQFAPSPLANLLAAPNSAVSPANLFPTLLAPTPAGASVSGNGGKTSSSKTPATGAPSDVGIESVLSGIEDVLGLLGRLEGTLERMKREQEVVFGSGSDEGAVEEMRKDGGEADGTPARIMALQQEYAQTLLSLQPILITSLIGALPIPLSSAIPLITPSDPGALPTISNLTLWAEQRAELDFSRREAVRAGAKAVLDVFKSKS